MVISMLFEYLFKLPILSNKINLCVSAGYVQGLWRPTSHLSIFKTVDGFNVVDKILYILPQYGFE